MFILSGEMMIKIEAAGMEMRRLQLHTRSLMAHTRAVS